MKTRNLLLTGIIILSGMLIFTSCSKDDEPVAEDLSATETEAAEMVASSLADGTSGTASDIETAAALTNEAVGYESNLKSATTNDKSLSCGESADTTMVTAGTGVITYNNTKTYNYMLDCDTLGNPVMLDMSFTYDGEFDAPRLASTHSVSGNFEITQIEYTSDMYLINGTWQRSGGFESKIGNQANRQATIQFELVDVAVEKEPKEIDNGTIHFSMSGSSGRGSFSYDGTITFTGNREAIIEISGTRYVTNLETGEVEEQ
ncbi:hypothetical protein [Prolixibacter sp. SD074]|uniref:hypothetical protein n=1 Tax=Prolixibacter sp. SD074 TaxID=2652391 RepID=UPI001283E2BF|nr:hypothetical protein [Prolixibacter sp. SD074]GET28488.1 hypothetical protein SD074_06900 [Prolixibacter sp. SD074]